MAALSRHIISLFLLLILAALPVGLFNMDETVSIDVEGMGTILKEFFLGAFFWRCLVLFSRQSSSFDS